MPDTPEARGAWDEADDVDPDDLTTLLDYEVVAPSLWTTLTVPGQTDPALRWDEIADLIDESGTFSPSGPVDEADIDLLAEHDDPLWPPLDSSPAPPRGSALRSGYALAAAEPGLTGSDVVTWAAGRVRRHEVGDGATVITAEWDPPPGGMGSDDAPWILPLRSTDTGTDELQLLLIMVADLAGGSGGLLVGEAVVRRVLELSRLVEPELLSADDLDGTMLRFVPASVAVARERWRTAWREAGRRHPRDGVFYQAVLQGIRLSAGNTSR